MGHGRRTRQGDVPGTDRRGEVGPREEPRVGDLDAVGTWPWRTHHPGGEGGHQRAREGPRLRAAVGHVDDVEAVYSNEDVPDEILESLDA